MSQVHGTIDRGNPRCLHCVLKYAIAAWAKQNAERNGDGVIVLELSLVIVKAAEVIAELIHQSGDPAEKQRFERYAQECLAGAFHHQRTGETVAVSVNDTGRDQ